MNKILNFLRERFNQKSLLLTILEHRSLHLALTGPVGFDLRVVKLPGIFHSRKRVVLGGKTIPAALLNHIFELTFGVLVPRKAAFAARRKLAGRPKDLTARILAIVGQMSWVQQYQRLKDILMFKSHILVKSSTAGGISGLIKQQIACLQKLYEQ